MTITDDLGRVWEVRRPWAAWRPRVRPVAFAGHDFGAGRRARSGGGRSSEQVSVREARLRRRAERRERREARRDRTGAPDTVWAAIGAVLLLPVFLVTAWIAELIEFLILLFRLLLWLLAMPFYLLERLLLVLAVPIAWVARRVGLARWPVEVVNTVILMPDGTRRKGPFARRRFLLRNPPDHDPFLRSITEGLAAGRGLPAVEQAEPAAAPALPPAGRRG